MQKISALVFTDLDGTLLDERYDLAEAAAAMNHLAKAGVYAIPVTSKTWAEMSCFADLLDYPAPAICENGAITRWSNGTHADVHGNDRQHDYLELCTVLQTIKERHGFLFRGFVDLNPREVATLTGLTPNAALAAQQRLASEPLQWLDNSENLELFALCLQAEGLAMIPGGRFLHVIKAGCSKENEVVAVRHQLQECSGRRLPIIACGDSLNDLAMLAIADWGVVFPGKEGVYMAVPNPNTLRAAYSGADGWSAALAQVLDSITPQAGKLPGQSPQPDQMGVLA